MALSDLSTHHEKSGLQFVGTQREVVSMENSGLPLENCVEQP